MSGSIFIALLQNAGLLLAMAFAFDLVRSRRSASLTWRRQFCAGMAMGAIGIAMVATAHRLPSGVIFDTRSVLLAVTGLFMGGVPTAVAVAMTGGYRLLIGGTGSIIGVAITVASGLIGVLWRGVRGGRLEKIPVLDLYALGLVVHAVMLALVYLIPDGVGPRVLAEIWLPVVLVHPITTVALGILSAHRLRHWRIVRELHESEERFRLLAENAHDLVYRLEVFPAPKFSYVSPSAESLTGYGVEEFYADSELLFKIVHPDDRGALEAGIRACAAAVTLRWIRKDGRVVWGELHSTPIVDASGRLIAFEGMGRDVTESRHAMEALQEQDARLRLALEASNQGLYNFDVTTGIEKVTDEYAQMLGEDPRGFDETRDECLERVHPDDRRQLAASLDDYLSGKAPRYRVESRRRHRDGHWIWTLSHGTIVARDDRGWPTRMIGTVQDVTALKQAELAARTAHAEAERHLDERKKAEEERLEMTKQLLQSQRLESLGSLAGGIAHDINNVLAAISNAAFTHRRKLGDAEPLAVALDTITSACVRGRSVVQSLLYFARKELGSRGPVDLNVIALEIVSLLDQTTLKRIRLVTDLETPLEPIEGDAAALNHAIMNLCLNSSDAMPGGGEVTIRTRRVSSSRVEISVRDNGPGMSPEVRARAIEPFFTTKPLGKGTGLGLAMVYGTTKAHGGTCEIRSEPGHGTEIVLSFPAGRVEAQQPAHAATSSQFSAPVRRLRILLVDDDALILESFPPLLDAMGHEVETADSGLAAISRLQAGLEVDLVILDMNMPGLTGAETLPRILELRPEQTVLISTGYTDSDLSELIGDNPRLRNLRKPFSAGELDEVLGALFGASAAVS